MTKRVFHLQTKCILVCQTVSVPEFDGRGLSAVKKFESNQLAANTPNEDRRSAATCLQVSISSPPRLNLNVPSNPEP